MSLSQKVDQVLTYSPGKSWIPNVEAIIIAPFFDYATATSFEYTFYLAKILEGMGIHTYHIRPPLSILGEELAFRIKLWYNRRIGKETVIVYAGHAFEDRWVGQNMLTSGFKDNVLASLVNLQDAGILKGTIAIAIPACLNGQELAPKAVEKGCRAFFASTTYMYAGFPEPDHNYMKDFHEHWATIPISLFLGKTTSEALDIYREWGNKLIKVYEANSWDGAKAYTRFLDKNIRYLEVFGDKQARLKNFAQ